MRLAKWTMAAAGLALVGSPVLAASLNSKERAWARWPVAAWASPCWPVRRAPWLAA